MDARVVAIVDWRAAAQLKDNARLLERAGLRGKQRARGTAGGNPGLRSLVVRADGSCDVRRFTPATVARRLAGSVPEADVRKAGTRERG